MPFKAQGSDAGPSSRSSPSSDVPVGPKATDPDSEVVEPATSLSEQSGQAPVPTPRRHILVVDDDEWIRDLLERVLLRHRYAVETVEGAEQALTSLQACSYDLVISDIRMAGMDGLELTSRITLLYPNLPVILITAHGDTDLMRVALRRGADDFIPKPFNIETIPLVVERNLERLALKQERDLQHEDTVMVSTVRALAAAIDAKEPYTAEHSRRVALLAGALSEVLGLPENERRILTLAAEVHDVGKIGVPDTILNKPGQLSEEEWQAMRLHPVQGAEIVGRVPQLTSVADAVRHHHERMDGNGYPDGLQGEAIPLPSRVIAVADAYEVMTSDRVYRRRLPVEEALHRLQEATGSQFDPEIVSAFLQLYPDSLPI